MALSRTSIVCLANGERNCLRQITGWFLKQVSIGTLFQKWELDEKSNVRMHTCFMARALVQ